MIDARLEAAEKARTLIEALPYIRSYRGRTVVVKLGGAALDDPRLATLVAEDLALMQLVGIRLVVVHGGGPQISHAMKQAGVEPRFVDGLRVTDEDSIGIVRSVLVGTIAPDLVARLCGAGISALALSGIDGNLLKGVRATGPQGQDLGHVGEIESVDAGLLESLLANDHTPVISSIAVDAIGSPLNVNADAAAGAVAAAVGATKLVFLTNVEGLYRDLGDEGSLISEMKLDELAGLVPELSTGMRPKAVAAVDALRAGVAKVHILDGRIERSLLLEVFTDEGVGTQVLP
jgi:acetylglutamate kinase